MFENAEISVDALPQAATVEWQALDSRYARRLQAETVITALLLSAGAVTLQVVRLDIGIPFVVIWTSIAVVTLAGVAWPLVSVPRKGYASRERDLVYRTGVLWRAEHAIPFNRVQHVETASKPLDRAFGLKSLHFYTAGASGSDLRIHGLPADAAERLRRFVLERAGVDVES